MVGPLLIILHNRRRNQEYQPTARAALVIAKRLGNSYGRVSTLSGVPKSSV